MVSVGHNADNLQFHLQTGCTYMYKRTFKSQITATLEDNLKYTFLKTSTYL